MREFVVGDIVTIVREPNRDCAFVWVPGMDDFCGKTATISGAFESLDRGYYIDIDNGRFKWDGPCFQEFFGGDESEMQGATDEDIMRLLAGKI